MEEVRAGEDHGLVRGAEVLEADDARGEARGRRGGAVVRRGPRPRRRVGQSHHAPDEALRGPAAPRGRDAAHRLAREGVAEPKEGHRVADRVDREDSHGEAVQRGGLCLAALPVPQPDGAHHEPDAVEEAQRPVAVPEHGSGYVEQLRGRLVLREPRDGPQVPVEEHSEWHLHALERAVQRHPAAERAAGGGAPGAREDEEHERGHRAGVQHPEGDHGPEELERCGG
mmetsp:Transcript_13725/g.46394  ORF Transcript_13725/g.46394 Transcript_13725/m.46394 type:complete len:227 (+) Transcript_13725:155-835(+)